MGMQLMNLETALLKHRSLVIVQMGNLRDFISLDSHVMQAVIELK
jgi:hypothetical protein